MFREMRRKKQQLPLEEAVAVMERGSSGVLAVLGEGGYPYAVPLNYVFHGGKLYFHCAGEGHKLDAIRQNPKVSFCVVDQDKIVPEEFTSYFRSAIAFGTAGILEDAGEKRRAMELLADKYSPGQPGRDKAIEKSLERVCVVEVAVRHLTGKKAIEL